MEIKLKKSDTQEPYLVVTPDQVTIMWIICSALLFISVASVLSFARSLFYVLYQRSSERQ